MASAPGVHLTLIGGDLRSSSMSTLGPLAELTLSRLSVDKAFLGADGVVADFGLCEASAQQADSSVHHRGRRSSSFQPVIRISSRWG